MRYISKIDYNWGAVLGRARFRVIGSDEGTVTVHDDSTGNDEVISIRQLCCSDYYGAGIERDNSFYVVVKLSWRDVLLHKYIDEAKTEFCHPEFEKSNEDLGVICEGALIGVGNRPWSGEHLALNTTNECIELIGTGGSVVLRTDSPKDDKPRIYNLFGLLVQLCRETEINIMSYKSLRLYSPGRGYETRIKFTESVEARRFFTKMYIEICGR